MQRRAFNSYLLATMAGINLTAISGLTLADNASSAQPNTAAASSSDALFDKATTPVHYASASVDDKGEHWLSVMDINGAELMSYLLPSRAHQVQQHPTKALIFVVARRPGHYIFAIDMLSAKLVQEISPSAGQHFSGHMQISPDGRYLYTTENISNTSAGRVVVRDIEQSFAVVAQYDSGGLGPHQLKLLNKQNLMAVANGGIHTNGREKLNLDSMQSNLSYIDLLSGNIVEQVQLSEDLAQLSIRHIDVNHLDDVVIAMQYQGEKSDIVPLVAVHNRQRGLKYLAIPDNDYFPLQQYCGSVCFDRSGTTVAVSAPRGNSVLFWDLTQTRYLGKSKVRDGCGLAVGELDQLFIVSSGLGRLYAINPVNGYKKLLAKAATQQWDNHLAALL